MRIEASAVILSGGKNTRMNGNTKAFLTIDSERFIDKIINNLCDFQEIIISCNNFKLYSEYEKSYKLIKDEFKDIGPIGGIYSALKEIGTDRAFIVAADMPFINKSLIRDMINIDFKGDVLVPIVDNKEQPLFAVYKKSCIPKIKSQIDARNYKLKSIINELDVSYIYINDSKSMTNINTPNEYEAILKKDGPTIINVVGSCSNVGKTTVIVGLIEEIKRNGYSVSTIKHDVHGFDIDKEGKDTWKHRKAGATSVCISSSKRFAMIKEVSEEIDINEIISKVDETDFLIIEGYKNSNFRKIEVARKEITTNIITSKEKLIAVVSDFNPEIDNVHWVNFNEYEKLFQILLKEKSYQEEVKQCTH